MHDTKGDVELMNSSREKTMFMILCNIQNESSLPLAQKKKFHDLV